ncbi:MAG: AgmX/PglI C-terminal domain-containing protein [Deltaproteobacteria bacterium]|nr:AgmX/PglI C-terminal domain-containing protein [Deltaproteobacteria bacterium]
MFPASRVITIGQSPDSAIRLEAGEVAPRHAVLYVDNGRVVVADNGGTSGVLVNGQPITTAPISGFDEVRIGEFRLKVEMVGGGASFRAPGASPSPPAPSPSSLPQMPAFAPPSSGARSGKPASQPRPVPQAPSDSFAPARVETYPSIRREPGAPERPARGRPSGTEVVPGRGNRRGRVSEPPPPPPADRGATPASHGLPPTVQVPAVRRSDSYELVDDLMGGRGQLGTPGLGDAVMPIEEPATVRIDATSMRGTPAPEPMTLDDGVGYEDTSPRSPRLPVDSAPYQESEPPFEPQLAEGEDGFLPQAFLDFDEDDDEDDDDKNFVAPFSLLDNVVRERFRTPIKSEPIPVVEVIRYRDGRLLDLDRVRRGGGYRFFDQRSANPFELLKYKRNGRARLFFNEGLRGNVVSAGQTTPLSDLCTEQYKADKKGRLFSVELGEGDFAHVKLEGEGFLVRFVRAPLAPPVRYALSFSREDKLYAGSAFLGIMLMLLGIWIQALISPPELFAMEEEVEFAEVSLKDLELEKPEEPPPPEPPPPEPEPPPPADVPPPPEAPKERPKKRSPREDKAAPPEKNAAQQQVENALAALDSIVPASPDKNLSAKVSNIAAVKVPSGSTKRFQVSGPIGKLPGGEVQLAVGSGGRETRSAAKLLEGKSVANLSGGGSGKVRGTVSRIPARQIGTSGGFLSREEILKVVNAGISDIQRCYERELMKSPDLAGKVVFDWVISPSGSVESTRVRSSTVRSEGVTACISGVIKGWHFPKPTGGSVKVTFPFTFRSQSF